MHENSAYYTGGYLAKTDVRVITLNDNNTLTAPSLMEGRSSYAAILLPTWRNDRFEIPLKSTQISHHSGLLVHRDVCNLRAPL